MENIFEVLARAESVYQDALDLSGKSYGLCVAVVAEIDDPLQLGRIRVLMPSKGAKTVSNWLSRLTLHGCLSMPLLSPGDTVVVGFFEGNPAEGVYLGALNNVINPPAVDEAGVVLATPGAMFLSPQGGFTLTIGAVTISLDMSGNLNISGISSFKVNNKQVVAVGADTNNGKVVSKGWS